MVAEAGGDGAEKWRVQRSSPGLTKHGSLSDAEGRCQNTLEQGAQAPTAQVGPELLNLPGVDPTSVHAPSDPKQELFG